MKYVQIEFPDNSIHNVFINGYYYNEKLDKYIIDYYDLTARNKGMYAIIINYKGTLYHDPYDIENTYDEIKENSIELNVKNIQDEIKYLPKKTKEEIEDRKKDAKKLYIYKNPENNKYFIHELTCRIYGVGKGFHYIDKKQYREVTINEIENIKIESQKEKQMLLPCYRTLNLKKDVKKLVVYKDTDSKKIYIDEETANENEIGKGIHYINNKKYKEVTQKEINNLIKFTKKKEYYYLPLYKEISFKLKTKKLQIYQNKISNKYLISEEISKKYEIGQGNHYINKKKYIEVKSKELEELYKKAYKIGEYLIPEFKTLVIKDKTEYLIVYMDEITYKCYIEKDICNKYKVGRDYKKIKDKRCMEVSAYEIQKIENLSIGQEKNLKAKFEVMKIENTFKFVEEEKTNECNYENDYIMNFKVYKDESKDKLYIDKNIYELYYDKVDNSQIQTINNKKIIEISLGNIKKIERKSKHPRLIHTIEELVKENKEKTQIIVYRDINNNNKLFINSSKYKENKFKYINNQECYELSLEELSKLKENKNNDVQVKTVYLSKEIENKKEEITKNNKQEKIEILIARTDDEVYIPRTLAEIYKINWQKEIGIENKIYVKVNEDIIQMIKEINKEIDNPFEFKTIKIKLMNKANNA